MEQLVAAANVCDEQIILTNPQTINNVTVAWENQFEINGCIDSSQASGEVINNMLSAMAGSLSYIGGQWNIFPGIWYGMPTGVLTAASMVAPMTYSPKKKARDLFNEVRAQFVSPAAFTTTMGPSIDVYQNTALFDNFNAQWKKTDMVPYSENPARNYGINQWLTQDRGVEYIQQVNFPLTISHACCQRLSKIMLRRNRWQGVGSLTLSLESYNITPVDNIAFDYPRYGWTQKLFTVTSASLETGTSSDKIGAPTYKIGIQETDPSIYEWCVNSEVLLNDVSQATTVITDELANTPTGMSQSAPSVSLCAPVTNLVAESGSATMVHSSVGISTPAILVTWNAPTVSTATGSTTFSTPTPDTMVVDGGSYNVQISTDGAVTWNAVTTIGGNTTAFSITGLSDGTIAYVRVQAVRQTGLCSEWNQVGPVIVSDTLLNVSAADVYYGDEGSMLSTVLATTITAVGAAGGAASAAQETANTANTNAGLASAAAAAVDLLMTTLSTTSQLLPGTKATIVADYNTLLSNLTLYEGQAAAVGVSTTATYTTYVDAISALITYLGGLTSPVPWYSATGLTDINGTTFASTFEAAYSAQSALLSAIAATINSTAIYATPAINLVPDSNLQFGIGPSAYWSNPGSAWSVTDAISTSNPDPASPVPGCMALIVSAAASGEFQFTQSAPFQLVAGQTYTLSGFIDAYYITAGSPGWSLFNTAVSVGYAGIGQAPGQTGRVSTTFTFSPAGVAIGTAVPVVLIFDVDASTISSGGVLLAAAPMIQPGSVMTAYIAGVAATNSTTGLAHGAMSSAVQGVITGGRQLSSSATVSGTTTSLSAIAPIASLMPSQAGADVTASHQSATTASLSNQSLDNLADGNSYKRVSSSIGIQNWKVAAHGDSATIGSPGLWLNNVLQSSGSRSYNVAVISRSTMATISITTYDVFGNSANAPAMANALNALTVSDIVIIWTDDEPQGNHLSGGLPAAMYRCGASTLFASPSFQYRSAYLLVGYPGLGQGNGIEMYSGSIGNDPNAYCETSVSIVDGNIQGLNGALPFAADATCFNYSAGGTVDSLKPAAPNADVTGSNTANDVATGSGRAVAEHGADITGNHTSANSNQLGGVGAGSITPITGLMPSQAGADVTAQQAIVYTGSSESIVPNGRFILNNAQGWFLIGASYDVGSGAGSWNDRILISPSNLGGNFAASPVFSVVGGATYMITVTGFYGDVPVSPNPVMRVNYGSASTGLQGWASSSSYTTIYLPFAYNFENNYSFEWVCPGGLFASIQICTNGTTGGNIYLEGVTCVPYGATGQWGADVTALNTSANTTSVGSLSSGAVNTLANQASISGAEMLTDANFQSGTGWNLNTGAYYDSSQSYLGTQSMNLSSGAWCNQVCQAQFISGHVYQVQCWMKTNCASAGGVGIYFEGVDGPAVNILSTVNGNQSGGNGLGCFVPSGTTLSTWTQLQFTAVATATKTMGISIAVGYGPLLPGTAWIDNVSCIDITSAQSQLGGVTASSITPIASLVTSGSSSSLNKQGTLVTGSGQTLSTVVNTTSIEIVWNPETLYYPSGAVSNIPGGNWTWSGLTPSTTYYLYLSFNVVTLAFGQAYCATADAGIQFQVQSSCGDNWVPICAGSTIETEASGGTGGSGGTVKPPPGCPALEMYVNDEMRVANLEVGSPLDCTDGEHAVEAMNISHQPCTRLWTDAGHELITSDSTPFNLPDGSQRFAPDMAGALVLTDTGHGTATQWMQCHTESVQARLVNRIHAGDRIFAAGTTAHARIYSHNYKAISINTTY
jgi:hypothetical protein